MNNRYKHKKLARSIILISIIIVVFVTTVSFTYKYFTTEEAKTKIDNIEKSISDLRATMN
jgi:hypothetical protein